MRNAPLLLDPVLNIAAGPGYVVVWPIGGEMREREGKRGKLGLGRWVCWCSGADDPTMQTPLMFVGREEPRSAPTSGSLGIISACLVMEYIAQSHPGNL